MNSLFFPSTATRWSPRKDPDPVVRMDDVIADRQILELGDERPSRGPADQDFFLREEIAFGENDDLLFGIAEPFVQVPEQEAHLASARKGARVVGYDRRDIVLGEEGGQALARALVDEVDRTDLPLFLELLEIFEEERESCC